VIWLVGFFLIALLDWIAAGKRMHRVRVITKPLSLIMLIIWFGSNGGWASTGVWFGSGLIFSLLGDIFLLLRPRFFIAGLTSFLLAHLCYVTGFLHGKIVFNILIFLPITFVIMLGVLIYPRIVCSVRRKIENRKLTIPVILYMFTITSMLFFAQLTWFKPDWGFLSAVSVSLGAFLFTISDSVLAINKFSKPLHYSNFLIMFTYHLGQFGIIFGFLNKIVR